MARRGVQWQSAESVMIPRLMYTVVAFVAVDSCHLSNIGLRAIIKMTILLHHRLSKAGPSLSAFGILIEKRKLG